MHHSSPFVLCLFTGGHSLRAIQPITLITPDSLTLNLRDLIPRRIKHINIILRLLPPPRLLHPFNWENVADCSVTQKCNDQPSGICNVIVPLYRHRRLHAHLVEEPIEVRRHRDDVHRECTKVPPAKEVILCLWVHGVQVWDAELAATDEVVVADKDSCDGGEEDLVGGEEVDEDGCRREEIPGADCEGENCSQLVRGFFSMVGRTYRHR